MMFKKFVLSMFIAGMIPSAHAQLISENALNTMRVGLELVGCYGTVMAVSTAGDIVHEYGHALAGKFLYGDKIDITIGNYEKTGYKIPFSGFTLHSFDSLLPNKWIFVAYVSLNGPSSIKNTIIAVFGPMAGMLFGAAILKYSNGDLLWQAAALNCIVKNAVNFIPMKAGEYKRKTDGYRIMENVGFGKDALKKNYQINQFPIFFSYG